MKRILYITCILLVILIPCYSQQQKSLYEFSFVDAKFDTILLDCNKRSPKSIKQFTVHIGYKSDYTSIVINGVNKNKFIEDYEYCGYTEVNDHIYFIYGDCRDGIINYIGGRCFEMVEPELFVGGTPYSWTYLIKNNKIYYVGNTNKE